MGLPVSIHLRERVAGAGFGPSEAVNRAVDGAFDVMRHYDRMFSPYRPDSLLNAVRAGRISIDSAGPEFDEVMSLADTARDLTGGFFDVHFAGPIDPSGLVKGWATEKAARVLSDLDVDFYINAGGDISCAATTTPWRLGVEHPFDTAGLITVVALRDAALATSGTAHRGQHIVDPKTGEPAAGLRQVTVIGRSLTWSDIWATAIVAAGPTSGIDLVRKCESGGYQVFAVTGQGEVLTTSGFVGYQVQDLPQPPSRMV